MQIIPRLALGASWNPNVFDRTGILSLCWGDPGVGPTPYGPLIAVKFQDHVVGLLQARETASKVAPRSAKRTGYGSRLKWDLTLTYETNAPNPTGAYAGEGTDNSLFAIAALLGQSASGVAGAAFSQRPPYLFLTTCYQDFNEQWIPVELDPADTTDPRQPFGPKTWLRSMDISLVSRQTYSSISSFYVPSLYVRPSVATLTLGAFPLTGIGPFTGSVNFSAPLDPIAQVGEAILVWYSNLGGLGGGPYVWHRWILTSIASNRLSASIISQQQALATPVPATFRVTSSTSEISRMPNYTLVPFAGAAPVKGFVPNDPRTQLIGGGLI